MPFKLHKYKVATSIFLDTNASINKNYEAKTPLQASKSAKFIKPASFAIYKSTLASFY